MIKSDKINILATVALTSLAGCSAPKSAETEDASRYAHRLDLSDEPRVVKSDIHRNDAIFNEATGAFWGAFYGNNRASSKEDSFGEKSPNSTTTPKSWKSESSQNDSVFPGALSGIAGVAANLTPRMWNVDLTKEIGGHEELGLADFFKESRSSEYKIYNLSSAEVTKENGQVVHLNQSELRELRAEFCDQIELQDLLRTQSFYSLSYKRAIGYSSCVREVERKLKEMADPAASEARKSIMALEDLTDQIGNTQAILDYSAKASESNRGEYGQIPIDLNRHIRDNYIRTERANELVKKTRELVKPFIPSLFPKATEFFPSIIQEP